MFWLLFPLFCIFVNAEECGISPSLEKYFYLNLINGNSVESSDRILGGSRSENGDWPWAVHIFPVGCSGSIIGDRWVLSAAHCVVSDVIDGVREANTIGVGNVYDGEQRVYSIKERFVYPHYSFIDHQKDALLLKINGKFDFGKNVSKLCLGRKIDAMEGESAVAAGWGNKYIYQTGEEPYSEPVEYLHEGLVPILNNDICFEHQQNETSKICGGSLMHGTTPGDSGGPLMVIRNNKWYSLGITSSGDLKPLDEITWKDHGEYAQTSYFCDWIQKITNSEVVCEDV
uniref:Peptidase S1 domain-containing protein n=1 Tax=Panagrolaimus sp. JU765 TaxID=591449 RepID=A0AC34RFL5_9BILA